MNELRWTRATEPDKLLAAEAMARESFDLRSTIYGKWNEKCGFSLSIVAGIQRSLKEIAKTDAEKDEMASKIEGLFREVLEINREVDKENKAKGLKSSQQLAVALHNQSCQYGQGQTRATEFV